MIAFAFTICQGRGNTPRIIRFRRLHGSRRVTVERTVAQFQSSIPPFLFIDVTDPMEGPTVAARMDTLRESLYIGVTANTFAGDR